MEFIVTFKFINPLTNKIEIEKIDVASKNIHTIDTVSNEAISKYLENKFQCNVSYKTIMKVGVRDV